MKKILLGVLMLILLASSSQASAQSSRRLTVSGTIDGTDDETFGSNEHGKTSFTRESVLSDNQPQNILTAELRWGGECRVELNMTGQRLDNGDVRIEGIAKLFEGVSESSDDLDGKETFSLIVPKGKSASHAVTVRNTDEGGDFADVTMTFNNSIVE